MNRKDALTQDKGFGVAVDKEDNDDYIVYGLRSGFAYMLTPARDWADEHATNLNEQLVKS